MKLTCDLVAILGPTASGKTCLAAAVARALGGEIISADSRQVYRGMDLGTGKDLAAYGTGAQRVPVHLIDIVEPGYEFNLFEFQRRACEAYDDIRARGRNAILCGGTGLYLEAILMDYDLPSSPPDPGLRAALSDMRIPEMASRLAQSRRPHNTTDLVQRERLLRAIEVAETVRPPPDAARRPRLAARVFGLSWPREVMRRRITERLRQRLDAGLADEVRTLLRGGLSAEALSFYGLEYRYVTQYVVGGLSANDMFQKLNAAIHQYAKRQATWFRRMERRGVVIRWLEGADAVPANVEWILKDVVADGAALSANAAREGDAGGK